MKLPTCLDIVAIIKALVLVSLVLIQSSEAQIDSAKPLLPAIGVIYLNTSEERVSLKIPIKNNTDTDFSIAGIQVSCNCTKPSVESEVLRAGQTVNLYTTLSLGGRPKVGSQVVVKAEDVCSKISHRILDVQIAVTGLSNTAATELEIPVGGVGVFSCVNRSIWPVNAIGIDCDLKGIDVVCKPSSITSGKVQEFHCEVRNVSNVLSPGESKNVVFTCFTSVKSDDTELKQVLAEFPIRLNLTTPFRLIPASLRISGDERDYSLIIDCSAGDARKLVEYVQIERNGLLVEDNWKAIAASDNWIRVTLSSALTKQCGSLKIRLLGTDFDQNLDLIQEN